MIRKDEGKVSDAGTAFGDGEFLGAVSTNEKSSFS